MQLMLKSSFHLRLRQQLLQILVHIDHLITGLWGYRHDDSKLGSRWKEDTSRTAGSQSTCEVIRGRLVLRIRSLFFLVHCNGPLIASARRTREIGERENHACPHKTTYTSLKSSPDRHQREEPQKDPGFRRSRSLARNRLWNYIGGSRPLKLLPPVAGRGAPER